MELYDYKVIAHELIEEIVDSGLGRHRLYRKLQYFLHVSEKDAHIGSMTTIGQVQKAIGVLRFIKQRRIKDKKMKQRMNSIPERFLSGHKRSPNAYANTSL